MIVNLEVKHASLGPQIHTGAHTHEHKHTRWVWEGSCGAWRPGSGSGVIGRASWATLNAGGTVPTVSWSSG